MIFDWRAFCDTHRVPYVETGPSAARGNIYVHCPFCGADDPSEHLGLSLNKYRPYWGCWRNPGHRGRRPYRVIMALLSCPYAEAEQIVRAADSGAADRWEAVVAALEAETPAVGAEPEPLTPSGLRMPREFYPLWSGRESAVPFLKYLQDERSFSYPADVAYVFGLRYATTRKFRQRIIIPIRVDGRLVSWTARDITRTSKIRYLTLPDDPETARAFGYPPAVMNLKQTVYNIDAAQEGGRILVVCEGPLDVIRVQYHAQPDVAAIGVFGMPTEEQIVVISKLARRFDEVRVALDSDAIGQALTLGEQLVGLCRRPVSLTRLPKGVKDPGELSSKQVRALF